RHTRLVSDWSSDVCSSDLGIEAVAIDHRPFRGDRAAHEAAIDAELRRAGVQIVCLAGYMRLLTPLLIDAWQGRMLNVHPSLLPRSEERRVGEEGGAERGPR